MNKQNYIEKVTEQIRCKRALPLVTKELEDHIEDQKSDYMAEGMNATEAEEEAVRSMGDPIEVGVEMDRIHRPKMAWKMIGLIGLLNLTGLILLYLLRMRITGDMGNDPAEVEWIASGTGGNIDYIKYLLWMIAGFGCMIGICYLDYSWIGKYAKILAGGWILLTGIGEFAGAVYINGATYGIRFVAGIVLPLRPFLYLIVPVYGAILYSMRNKKEGYMGVIKAVLWQVVPVWLILRIPNLSMALSVEFTFLLLLSIAVWKDWFAVNKKRTLAVLWGIAAFLPVISIAVFAKLGILQGYQMRRIQALVHMNTDEADTFTGALRKIIAGAHLVGQGDYKDFSFFNSDYMLTFLIHYYGILAAVLLILIIGSVLFWFLRKSRHQKNQLGMIMGIGCVAIIFIQFICYILENLGFLPMGNNYCLFLTAGGSGMLSGYLMMGILLSIYRYQNVVVAI